MKKILSLVLALSLVLSLFTFPVNATVIEWSQDASLMNANGESDVTYKLTADIGGTLTLTGQNIAIDLAGHTWQHNGNAIILQTGFIHVYDSVGGGMIHVTASDAINMGNGTALFENITIKAGGSNMDAIFCDGGNLTVNNCTLSGPKAGINVCNSSEAIEANARSVVTVNGGTFANYTESDKGVANCAIEIRNNADEITLNGDINFENNKIFSISGNVKSIEDAITIGENSSATYTAGSSITENSRTWNTATIDYTYTAPAEEEPFVPGDLDGDGVAKAKDVTVLRRHVAGGGDSDVDESIYDIDINGSINAKDVTTLRRYISGGWEVVLPTPDEPADPTVAPTAEPTEAPATETPATETPATEAPADPTAEPEDGTVEIDINNLASSGSFTAAGYLDTQKVLNFESGGENSSTNHSIGTVDLSKYSKIIITYGTDPSVSGNVTVVLRGSNSGDLASTVLSKAKGWTDTTTTATFDVSSLSNNEELFLTMASNAFGFAVNKIELVEGTGESGDSGNTGSGEIAEEDYVVDMTQLSTSGAFTAAGINDLILNFNSGGTNSKSRHSIGTIDLSAYNTMKITYSNDPNLSTVGTIAVYNSSSQIALASRFLEPSGGWKKFAVATIDISNVKNFEEIFLALEHESGGIAVTQVVLSPDALPNLTPTDGRVDTDLVNTILNEAQKVADFARDNGFTYGNAAINPGMVWNSLNINAPAISTDERLSSCDRFVGWVLYRAGFTNQPEKHGFYVLQLASWLESLNFQKITDVSQLKAGDIVFTNHDATKPGNPGHVFLCASDNLGGNVYLRYDHGSTERIQCRKGTEVTAGQQPFREVIGDFFYAYRPNSTTLG